MLKPTTDQPYLIKTFGHIAHSFKTNDPVARMLCRAVEIIENCKPIDDEDIIEGYKADLFLEIATFLLNHPDASRMLWKKAKLKHPN